MMSNVDRLYDGLAEWIAEGRFTNPGVRIPLCRIHYAVSAPTGQPLMHTFIVYVVNNVKIACGGGRTLDEAARKCWLDLMNLKPDGLRGTIQAALDAAGEDGVVIPSEDWNPPPMGRESPKDMSGGPNGNGDAQTSLRSAVPPTTRRSRSKSSSVARAGGER